MKTNYTPAPWGSAKNRLTRIIAEDKTTICMVHNYSAYLSTDRKKRHLHDGFEYVGLEESFANAKLIAAAPELLEALKQYVNSLLHDYEIDKWYESYKDDKTANRVLVNAIAVIKKATSTL